MGAAELRAAFNDGAAGDAQCSSATSEYDRHEGVEYTILRFYGTRRDGTEFAVHSDRLRPGSNPVEAAREAGAALATAAAKAEGSP